MEQVLERLEERVRAAIDLIARLRADIARLESELAAKPLVETAVPVASDESKELAEEVARLQTERAVVRDRIRELIKEIDAVAW